MYFVFVVVLLLVCFPSVTELIKKILNKFYGWLKDVCDNSFIVQFNQIYYSSVLEFLYLPFHSEHVLKTSCIRPSFCDIRLASLGVFLLSSFFIKPKTKGGWYFFCFWNIVYLFLEARIKINVMIFLTMSCGSVSTKVDIPIFWILFFLFLWKVITCCIW